LLPSRFAPPNPASATTDPLEMQPRGEEAFALSGLPNRDRALYPRSRPSPAAPFVSRAQPAPVPHDTASEAEAEPAPRRPRDSVRAAVEETIPVPLPGPYPDEEAAEPRGRVVASQNPSQPAPVPAMRPAPGLFATPSADLGERDRPAIPRAAPARNRAECARPGLPSPPRAQMMPVAVETAGGGRAASGADAGAMSGPPRPPDIYISIGQVEVHAAPARNAPIRPDPPRRPQRSLAEYLMQRK